MVWIPQPTFDVASFNHQYDEDSGELVPTSVGWSLSWNCQLSIGPDVAGGPLYVDVCTSGADQRNGITKRTVTPEQISQYAHLLLQLIGEEGEHVSGTDPQRTPAAG